MQQLAQEVHARVTIALVRSRIIRHARNGQAHLRTSEVWDCMRVINYPFQLKVRVIKCRTEPLHAHARGNHPIHPVRTYSLICAHI